MDTWLAIYSIHTTYIRGLFLRTRWSSGNQIHMTVRKGLNWPLWVSYMYGYKQFGVGSKANCSTRGTPQGLLFFLPFLNSLSSTLSLKLSRSYD